MSGDPSIISPEFRARLEALEAALRRSLPAAHRGDRRSLVKKGISLEFSDHRAYVEGDDVRHLDWAGYARLDQLNVKVYHDEEDLEMHVLLDDTASMGFGTPRKAVFARQVAAAMVWVGLANGHRVSLGMLGDELDVVPRALGRAAAERFFERLMRPPGVGRAGIRASLERYVRERRPRGIVCLISDLFDRIGPKSLMALMDHPSREIDVVHVTAVEDLNPPADGDFRFFDSETGERLEVHLSSAVIDAFTRTTKAFLAEAHGAAKARGAAYVHVTSDAAFEDFCLTGLVRAGVLR